MAITSASQSLKSCTLIFETDALCDREKSVHPWDRKIAKRIAHVRQIKMRITVEKDGSVRCEWSRRPTLTKQNNPRPAKNNPSIHDKVESERGDKKKIL